MKRRTVASVAAVALMAGALGSTAGNQAPSASADSVADSQAVAEGAVADAFWVNRPESLQELTELSISAVRATPVSTVSGPSLLTEEPDVPAIPTQRITFEVEDRWFGEIEDKFLLFKTGSADEWIEHDPPYVAGRPYVLFLQERPDGSYIPAAPDGRFSVIEERIRSSIPGPLADKVDGESIGEARRDATTAKRQGG
jgi:hypothetical protein